MSILDPVARLLPPEMKRRVKAGRKALRDAQDRLFSVDRAAFAQALSALGMGPGDIVYVRSSYDEMRSIRATPVEIIETLCAAVGPTGTVAMPTYPMAGLSQVYLDANPMFDWRRTPSRAGFLTEIFRRMSGTERSLHPTHPLAARGAEARWLTEGHELSQTPFDERSPFQKLLERNALILSMGRFEAMTLRHFADHQIQDRIPYPIYGERTTTIRLIGKNGRDGTMTTRAHNPDLGCDHRVVLRRMAREGILRFARIGRVPISIVRLQPYLASYRRYHSMGLFHHYLKPPPAQGGRRG